MNASVIFYQLHRTTAIDCAKKVLKDELVI